MAPYEFVQCTICPTVYVGPGTVRGREETGGDGKAGAAKRNVPAQILLLLSQGCREEEWEVEC